MLLPARVMRNVDPFEVLQRCENVTCFDAMKMSPLQRVLYAYWLPAFCRCSS
jgi:hypothetical protein